LEGDWTSTTDPVPTALDNGIRSPRKLLATVVRKLVATIRNQERGRGGLRRDVAPRLAVLFRGEGNEKSPGLKS
jgi:hypothetical protein